MKTNEVWYLTSNEVDTADVLYFPFCKLKKIPKFVAQAPLRHKQKVKLYTTHVQYKRTMLIYLFTTWMMYSDLLF